jgi:hypothetical protein
MSRMLGNSGLGTLDSGDCIVHREMTQNVTLVAYIHDDIIEAIIA